MWGAFISIFISTGRILIYIFKIDIYGRLHWLVAALEQEVRREHFAN